METHYPTAADPPEIRNKLASLQSQKVTIEDLTLRLQHAQTEYKRLETEIKAYRASVAPIQKCPEEVLLMIFHAYTENDPALVTHLLPVCHRWYGIAANAPGLWNVIDIQFMETWDVKLEVVMATKKFETCLKHSASLPLHLTLNYEGLEPASSRLNDYLIQCLKKIDPGQDVDYISEIIEEGSLDLTHLTTEASMCHPDHAIELISELVGTNGFQMTRLESLEIYFPADETLGERIWRLFDWNAPNLAKLSISWMPPVAGPLATGYRESELSSLEDLELQGEVTHLDFLPLRFDAIKCLTLETDFRGLHQSLQLSRFTHLERLVLYCVPGLESTSSATITLPCLKNLFLADYSGPSDSWKVPLLQQLEISGYLGRVPDRCPNVQASHVLIRGSVCLSTRAHTHSFLRQILSKYTAMKQLTLPTRLHSIWEGLTQELTQTQESPLVLPVVVFAP